MVVVVAQQLTVMCAQQAKHSSRATSGQFDWLQSGLSQIASNLAAAIV
jgi:hypothetical protein